MRKPKILCLHGGVSSAAHFKEQLQVWPSNVLEEMDLVFIDAPFFNDDINFPTFRWYDTLDPTKLDSTFNQSIAYIEDTMAKLGPFDGVLGFSQGACIAAALPGMQAQGLALTNVEDIKFVVVMSGGKLGGFKLPAPKIVETAFSSPIKIPSLHCFGKNDFAKLTAIELLSSFVDPFVIFHSGAHEVPQLDEEGLKVMKSFMDKIQATFPDPNIRSLI